MILVYQFDGLLYRIRRDDRNGNSFKLSTKREYLWYLQKMNAIKLPFQFDEEKLLTAYKSIAEDNYHEIHNNYVTPHKLLSTHLISIENPELGNHEFVPNQLLNNLPYLLEVYTTFECSKETFRVHRLLSDAFIKEHRDIALNYEEGMLRIHIPIVTSPEISMKVNGENIVMLPGEAWYLDFDLPHEVTNTSGEERVHLIIDCVANPWWDELMKPHGKSRGRQGNRMTDSEQEAMEKQLESMGLKLPEE